MEPRFVTKDNCEIGKRVRLSGRSRYWGQNLDIKGKEVEGTIVELPQQKENNEFWWCKVEWDDDHQTQHTYRVTGPILDLIYTEKFKVGIKIPKVDENKSNH